MFPRTMLPRAILLVCLLAVTARAQAQSTLSGTVFGGGSPLANAVVDALNDGTTTVAGSSTTNASGQYSMALADGTYDLRVSPPSGSGFGQETVQNVVIAGNRIYDVILLAAGAGKVTGTVTGYAGAPIGSAQINVYTSNWQYLTSVTSDAAGHYEAIVSGSVNIEFRGNGNANAPSSWYASRSGIPIAGTTTIDVAVPAAKISGVVRDSSSAPVASASIEANGSSYDAATQMSFSYSAYTTASAAGAYDFMALSGGTSNFTVRPPSGSTLTPVTASVPISGDIVKDFTLPSAVFVSGVVRGLNGAPIEGATVNSYTGSWQYIASATTDAAGHYAVPSSIGTANLEWRGNGNAAAPQSWYASRSGLPIAGDTSFDVNLPAARLSGTTSDANGAVGSISIETFGSAYDSSTQLSFSSSAYSTSDAAGHYAAVVLNGNASITARPPSGSNLIPVTASITVAGDTVYDITMPAAVTLSGTIRGYGGTAIQGASVNVYTANWQYIASATTDSNGTYSVGASPATVNIEARGNGASNAPASWYASRSGLPVAGPTTFDFTLPVLRLDGTTTDSNGAPVPNVSLEVYGSSYDSVAQLSFSYSVFATTNAAGQYEMRPLKGQANFTVRPPNSSGFLPTQLFPSLTADLTQRIVLQRPDLSPPLITAGPVVIHLSDTSVSVSWTTNEPATSMVDYGVGGLTSTTATAGLSTNHIVTLQALTTLETYQFRVGSSDAAGNGPAYATGSFVTLASPGDITPPHITNGPSVVFVDQTSAIVQWETDEPATSSISFGVGGVLDTTLTGPAGVFTTFHSLALTGLSAETIYSARVTSADPDDNATASSEFPITTLAVPDTAAPIIISGPTIVSVTDTQIIVEWTTNEPATSGVSFNDGTHFDVVADATLSSTHQVTLSGLSPSTTYAITVSSTDAVGNGPSLGGPVSATTSTEADTVPPAISNVQLSQITVSSAVITFDTNEPAIVVINYGVDAGALDQTRADLSPSTSHSITLSGLAEGTQYFFTILATDSSGNSAAAGPLAFTTESSFVDQPPSQPGPLTGPASPSNAGTFALIWGASTDDVLLTGYEVFLDGAPLATVDASTLSYEVSGLTEGAHTFVVRATDSAAHSTDSAPFAITIDRTPPAFVTPDQIVVGTAGTGASVDYEASVTDNLDSGLLASCTPPSGSFFQVGSTLVTCSAIDAAGNHGEASFTITVKDEGAPTVVTPGDQTLEAAGGAGGAVATFAATAQDLVDGAITPVCVAASGSFFALGATVVKCTATDQAGNSASGYFTITVRDTAPPVIASARPSQSVLWPPNHQMVNLSILVSVSDAGDAAPVCRVSSVTSNEPIDGLGDGDTTPDWMGVSGLSLSLRAERGGKGNGRTYTIGVTCQDASGNTSQATTAVTVPKSQGK